MKVYIEAYDGSGRQMLGNLDGQGVINARQYKRTDRYKALSTFRTLHNRGAYYILRDESGTWLETVPNTTWDVLWARQKTLDITEQVC